VTVFGVRRFAMVIVLACAAAITVTPFMGGSIAARIFGVAVLALPPALAGIALRRTAHPGRAAAALFALLALSEGAGLFVIGFEGPPRASLTLMAGLALVPLVVLGLLYAWVFEDRRDFGSGCGGTGERA